MKRMFEIASENYQYTSDIITSTEHYSTYDGPANLLNKEETHRNILKLQSPEITKLKTKIRNNDSRKKQVFIPKAETVNMMRWMFDYATHLQSYPCPIAPELAIFLTAKWDMYIPRHNVTDIRDLWPGIYIIMSKMMCVYILSNNYVVLSHSGVPRGFSGPRTAM